MKRLILAFILLPACSLAPKYSAPEMNIPESYKEAGKWHVNSITEKDLEHTQWWQVYGDPTLNELEAKLDYANQNLKAAVAIYDQAKALTGEARAGLFPIISAMGDNQREMHSKNISNAYTHPLYNDTVLGASLSYEVDLWGKVRNTVAAAENQEKASAGDLAALSLSLHAELASNYFSLRADDEAQFILDETVKAYDKALYLMRQRYMGGIASALDVAEAETQLETAHTLASDMHLNRAQLEHAIAILVGVAPAQFSIPVSKQKSKRVAIAASLPSALLQRRPDIMAAEKRVQAANANIGVARAAYFPDFDLIGTWGYESQKIARLINSPSLFWSLGPSATMAIFDGGAIDASVQFAKASYTEAVANYKQTVLSALGEVEDNLVAINRLDAEMQSQSAAAGSAKRALAQANFRYQGGIVTYLDVVVIENIALQAQLAELNVRLRRQVASIQLIKALGGSWQNMEYF